MLTLPDPQRPMHARLKPVAWATLLQAVHAPALWKQVGPWLTGLLSVPEIEAVLTTLAHSVTGATVGDRMAAVDGITATHAA